MHIRESLFAKIKEDLGVTEIGNPDFFVFDEKKFGIDDGRSLQIMQSRKAIGGTMVFVIGFDFIRREAQNALLKMFEEPTPNTFFFVATPHPDSLLPTLRSRLSDLFIFGVEDKNPLAKRFVSADIITRQKLVESIVKEKDKTEAISLLHGVEEILYEESITRNRKVLSEIQKAKNFLHDKSASVKILLEHILLITPQI
jgi:DNA polymerase III delta prime subunit